MITTISIIEKELKENNLPFTGIYSGMPKLILSAVNDIKHFGIESLENRSLGKGAKRIAIYLAAQDTRKADVRNGKTILH